MVFGIFEIMIPVKTAICVEKVTKPKKYLTKAFLKAFFGNNVFISKSNIKKTSLEAVL